MKQTATTGTTGPFKRISSEFEGGGYQSDDELEVPIHNLIEEC